MTKRRRDFIRSEKRRLQAERVEWKKRNPEDAAIKSFNDAVERGDKTAIREGRELLRRQKYQRKYQQWIVRRAIKEKQAADELRAKTSLRKKIIERRKRMLEGAAIKPKRIGFFKRFGKMFEFAKRGA